MTIHPITSDVTFNQVIQENKSVLIDFYAVWCAPCKAIAPFIETHSEEEKYKDVYFAKIDVDELPKLSDDLEVLAMPTLLYFKDGQKVDVLVDPNPKTLTEFLDKAR